MRWLPGSVVTLLLILPQQPYPPVLEVEAVLDRAAEYVSRYENEAGVLTAEERYVQTFEVSAVSSYGQVGQRKTQRTLKSDFLMVKPPRGDAPWMGVRQVRSVGDQPVENLRDVKELAAKFDAWDSLKDES